LPSHAHSRTPLRGVSSVLVLLALALVALIVGPLSPRAVSAQTAAWVDTGGDSLNMRTAPGLAASVVYSLSHGDEVALLGEEAQQDGFTWLRVQHAQHVGWVAGFYITTDPDEVQVIANVTPPGGALLAPPVGGLTTGLAGAADLDALVARQEFEVLSVWHFDIASQRLLQYVPGAPPFVNSLAGIEADDVVMVRRAGTLGVRGVLPEASLTVAGTPKVLPTPPIGGLTQGVSGTTDPRFLVQAQDFTAESVSYFHVPSQQWLVYIPGAPDSVQTLLQGQMLVDSVVSVRRGPDAPRPPSSEDSDYFETSITYYYCVPGENKASHGDGGGYCGGMANGETVHEGAAACKPGLLGQRFTIEGDPTERVYECTDTGGSVLQDHRDIWFMHSDEGYAWWLEVGERAFIHILD